MSEELIFVSGGNGFIGAWCVLEALKTGHRVRTSVRDPTNAKKTQHLTSLPGAKERLEIVKIDLEKSSEQEYLKALEGCTRVLHTASPFYLGAKTDEELVGPAVKGTMGVLRAAGNTPTVKSVVVTSSVAAVHNTSAGKPDDYRWGEKDWNDPDKTPSYPKSKTLAEKAAWDYYAEVKDRPWSLCTINPVYVLGPCLSKELQTSAEVTLQMLKGLPFLPDLYFGVVDVRDVAVAHIRAVFLPFSEAQGRRFILYNTTIGMPAYSSTLKKEFPSYSIGTHVAPYWLFYLVSFVVPSAKTALHAWGNKYVCDNTPSREVLKIEYRSVERMVCDSGHSLVYHGFIPKKSGYKPPHEGWSPINA